MTKPDFLFETSWEVCNKTGRTYTALATKAMTLNKALGDNYILIGPDVWKETRDNPDFIEDNSIFEIWRDKAYEEGLRIRMGRWNTPARPIVILVDFTPLFADKNEIFGELWDEFKVDSISGNWDYIEPALFGYAAGRVIESFYNFHFSADEKIVAQFHDWMAGSGVLYLNKNVAQVGTLFTSHSTLMERTLSEHGISYVEQIEIPEQNKLAARFGITAKHSLERQAAGHADSFTCVSEITAKECKQFLQKQADVITPNGFDTSMLPPEKELEENAHKARAAVLRVAEALTGSRIGDDVLFTMTGSRYEFHNKGLNLFIRSLGELNGEHKKNKKVIALIAVPTAHSGPDSELKQQLEGADISDSLQGRFNTHKLHEPDKDAILRELSKNKLSNRADDQVCVIYVPAMLNKEDGLFNISYYELLSAMDLTIFPSCYDPWGFTPMESLALQVPSVTTLQTGFGEFIRKKIGKDSQSLNIIDYNCHQETEMIKEIARIIDDFSGYGPDKMQQLKTNAAELAKHFDWQKQIPDWYEAFDLALNKALDRYDLYKSKIQYSLIEDYQPRKHEGPAWKSISVQPFIPKKLEGLQRMANNLWWSWNYQAEELFSGMDEKLWEQVGHNPITLLNSLSLDQIKKLSNSQKFLKKYKQVIGHFDDYMRKAHHSNEKMIAYFSMEFGLHETIRTYSGGLGILAGDFIKEASDQNLNMIGISLFYKYGYFQQGLSTFGEQIAHYPAQEIGKMPLKTVRNKNGQALKITIAFPGRNLYARVWRVDVGRVPLYLLDSDVEENTAEDRKLTHQLYGGDNEYRLKQELLLGVGGIRMLNAMAAEPEVFHCNEGHSAFIGVERLRNHIQEQKLSFEQAVELVRATTLFTTHTPVPAGHDVFSEDLLRTYIPHYTDRLNLNWDEFMNLGRFEDNKGDQFSMSVLAMKLSRKVNGVSRIHGRVTREMFAKMFKGYYPEEIDIGYVTNGVHYHTWTAKEWQELYKETLGEGFLKDHSDAANWQSIHQVDNNRIREIKKHLKSDLVAYLKKKIEQDMTRRQENPKIIFETVEKLNEDALIIGFARRFATYKRAHLLFNNLQRLADLVNDEKRPVVFLYSGKAHPNDKAGQELIKRILEISRKPKFMGKVIFIENYNMRVARMMVHGVDVWLNTPTRPLEASGTSGQKAALNGVLNCSVLDGWWAEGYKAGTGWAIKEEKTYDNQQFQDELDAETVYNILESEIIPHFFGKQKGYSDQWVEYIKKSVAEVAPHFTMKRMMDDYKERFYESLFINFKEFSRDYTKKTSGIVAWKRKVLGNWEQVEATSLKVPDVNKKMLKIGEDFVAEISLNTAELTGRDLGIETVFFRGAENDKKKFQQVKEFDLVSEKDGQANYRCKLALDTTGMFDYAFRIFPKSTLLSSRRDFPLVKWL
ncbi:MAG: alpha-glucan family phosphorylase [Bacteroidales bacterium]|nr:alpha-glucan family phosphorylase [Bacteroidales bacterium]MCF8350932.1 alpha-glucan family phosphorylase [Bacteroidales bacterium]MCF8377411.1 alpha-glucan family phosphorylase [Bacteroidales bacterium]MCF8401446.1 alpha-glucan family phosphorylase [Bacteroidales bacterium]